MSELDDLHPWQWCHEETPGAIDGHCFPCGRRILAKATPDGIEQSQQRQQEGGDRKGWIVSKNDSTSVRIEIWNFGCRIILQKPRCVAAARNEFKLLDRWHLICMPGFGIVWQVKTGGVIIREVSFKKSNARKVEKGEWCLLIILKGGQDDRAQE